MFFGISILAAVIAGGFFWLGKTAMRKRIGSGTPNLWAAFVLNLIGGMAAAVALNPLIGWATSWKWVMYLGVFGALAVIVGGALDIAADKKPDRFAQTAAMIGPALLLVATSHWSEWMSAVHSQVTAYLSHVGM